MKDVRTTTRIKEDEPDFGDVPSTFLLSYLFLPSFTKRRERRDLGGVFVGWGPVFYIPLAIRNRHKTVPRVRKRGGKRKLQVERRVPRQGDG